MAERYLGDARAPATPALIRWGAVFGGVVLGFALLVVLSVLWLALGGETGGAITNNLDWFMAGSAIVAMFVGGLIAGWLSGVPRASAGFFNGLTVWALILIASIAVGGGVLSTVGLNFAGGANTVTTTGADGVLAQNADALWATLVALLIGAVSAGIGGAIGGAVTTPAGAGTMPERTVVYREPPVMPSARRETRVENADEHVGDGRAADDEETIVLPEEVEAAAARRREHEQRA